MLEYNLQETRYSDISEADIQHAVSSIKVTKLVFPKIILASGM